MAEVCLAWDEKEKRQVAIKIIKADQLEQETLDRFRKEAEHVYKLKHKNIIVVYSKNGLDLELVNKATGSMLPYIVMEYIAGGDLHTRLRNLSSQQFYPLEDVWDIFRQVCDAVQYAHEQGIIHRDLKPQNILFRSVSDKQQQIVLSDFGLAVEVGTSNLSFAHAGTLQYMAPEQFHGQPCRESDIFALGVILYRLCTKQFPFARSLQDFASNVPLRKPVAPSSINRALPRGIDTIIFKALEEDPTRRFASASLFWQSIEALFLPLRNEKIIDLQPTPKAGRTTKRLPVEGGATSGKMAAVGAGLGAGAGVVAAAGQRARSTNNPPLKWTASKSRHHLVRNPLVLLLMLVFLFLIASGGLAYAQPRAILTIMQTFGLSKVISNTSLQPGVTVMISPASQVVSDSFVVSGVPGTADATKLQISTRQLSYTTLSVTSPVTGTGVSAGPSAASGKLTFYNYGTIQTQVNSQTVFTGADGINVVTVAEAVLPAGVINGGTLTPGVVSVPAIAVKVGASGNIAALDINGTCCAANGAVIVKNQTAFTGGQDAQQYTFIQQSDVDAAVSAVQPGLVTEAQTRLKGLLQTGELLAGNPQCAPKSSVDQPIGNTGKAIPSATVTVSATCIAEAYKQADLNALAQTFLAKKVASDPTLGSDYEPVGGIVTTSFVQGINNGIVSLLLNAKQVWAYQFSTAQKQNLANLIKGLSATEAISKLKSQVGVGNVSIPSGVTILPRNSSQFTIAIRMPAGLSAGQGSTTPTVPAGTGNPTQGNGNILVLLQTSIPNTLLLLAFV